MTDTINATPAELRAFIERIELQNAFIKDYTEARKEVYDDAKSRGFCTKTIRKIVSLRQKQADQIAEEEAIEQLYRQALGMS
jgi:uncharacterized protein (UPF0335 family)